ncbi:MAG: hypothetical protein NTW38_03980 [Candidatus Aminicenantes bacterium]|nr:hypothetical protein [Candidatus Aminicenantes bacterium]
MKISVRIIFRSATILLLLVLLASAGVLEAGICTDAFKRCMLDPINQVTLTGGLYCLNGYYFCLKYIEPPK